jgi:hypothetical protein
METAPISMYGTAPACVLASTYQNPHLEVSPPVSAVKYYACPFLNVIYDKCSTYMFVSASFYSISPVWHFLVAFTLTLLIAV